MELQTVSIFKNWVELAADLPSDAERGKFYHAVCTYSLTGELPELDGILRHYFLLIKPVLDTSNRRKLAQLKGAQKRQKRENTSETNSQNDLQNGLQSDLQNELQNDLQPNSQNDLQTDLQNDLQTDLQNDLQNGLQSDLQNELQPNSQNELQKDSLRIRVRVREEEKESKEKVKKLFPTFVDLLPEKLKTEKMTEKWREWERFRRSKKKPISEVAAVRQMAMLATLTEAEAISSIEESIKNDYQGLFPPKNTKAAKPRKDFTGI